MIGNVLTLFKTLLGIIFLQKGPEDIPHSPLLFTIVAVVWFAVGLMAMMLIDTYGNSGLFIDVVLAFAGLGIYAIIVNGFGRRARLVRCLTAILGCGVVFSIVLFSGRLVMPLLFTENEASWAIQLIWFWSIPVEGHIIARTIERPWVIGFLIALAVLFAQLQLFAIFNPPPAAGA